MRSLVGLLRRDKRVRHFATGVVAALIVTGLAAAAAGYRPGPTRHTTVVFDEPATTTVTALTRDRTTTTTPAETATAPAPATTAAPGTCGTCGHTPPSIPFYLGEPAQLGDFDGTVIVEYGFGAGGRPVSTATVGDRVNIGVDIRNSTNHVVNMGTPAVLCATGLTPDGHTNHSLGNYPYLWWLTLAPFEPGQQLRDFPRDSFDLTADDVGTMTCEAVLTHDGPAGQIDTRRITRIPPVSFTVVRAPPTTQPQTNPASTSTTLGS